MRNGALATHVPIALVMVPHMCLGCGNAVMRNAIVTSMSSIARDALFEGKKLVMAEIVDVTRKLGMRNISEKHTSIDLVASRTKYCPAFDDILPYQTSVTSRSKVGSD